MADPKSGASERDDLAHLSEEDRQLVIKAEQAFAQRNKLPKASRKLQERMQSEVTDEPIPGSRKRP